MLADGGGLRVDAKVHAVVVQTGSDDHGEVLEPRLSVAVDVSGDVAAVKNFKPRFGAWGGIARGERGQ